MRLRYLQLKQYPPIEDVSVCFASASPLQRDYAIRFVVGVNGSGKSNLLRAVAELFLALSDERLPPFPITLIYELGQRGQSNHYTFIVDCPGSKAKASLWVAEGWHWPDEAKIGAFDSAIKVIRSGDTPEHFRSHIQHGSWPQSAGIALPEAVLTYTTGDLRPWRSIWSRNQEADEFNSGMQEGDYDETLERPVGWTMEKERTAQPLLDSDLHDEEAKASSSEFLSSDFKRPQLLSRELFKCALLAVALPDALSHYQQPSQDSSYKEEQRDLLKESLARGGWHQLVSVGFHARLQPTVWNKRLLEIAHDWCLCAGEVIAEPYPDGHADKSLHRILHFDLRGRLNQNSFYNQALEGSNTQGDGLLQLLGGHDKTPFELFKQLTLLHRLGLFDDLELKQRRQEKISRQIAHDKPDSDVGVLRFDELSDGEQMVLGRMALLHLLEGQHNSLLLLDEPETHFNDLWKRDIVSVVDGALANTSCEVMIATHAALVLTDALKDELIVLERPSESGTEHSGTVVRKLDSDIHTFGATGDHPLRDIFGAPDTVGRRASRLLEVLIAATTVAESIESQWSHDGHALDEETILQVLKVASVTEQGLTTRSVRDSLDSIRYFALHFGADEPLTMMSVLEAFICQTGPGYFQVELKRAWYRLREDDDHVA